MSTVYTVLCLVAQLCLTLCNPMDYSLPGSSVHCDSPGKNTRVGCHALLQGIVPTQGLNPGLPHCRQILLPTEPPGKPKTISFNYHSNTCIVAAESIFKSRDITLPTKVRLVKAMVFPVVMNGCESWTVQLERQMEFHSSTQDEA